MGQYEANLHINEDNHSAISAAIPWYCDSEVSAIALLADVAEEVYGIIPGLETGVDFNFFYLKTRGLPCFALQPMSRHAWPRTSLYRNITSGYAPMRA
jgi:hypothetical protein